MKLSQSSQGVILAISAFVMWGLAPVYFKQLAAIPAQEILLHRVVWSSLLLVLLILLIKKLPTLIQVFKQPKIVALLALTGGILFFNWGLFIWSVNNGHIMDASLGYYINPLLNVLLGVIFFKESLRVWQKVAVALAFTGVTIQVISFGSFPVIAFALAGSFAVYGLLRKKLQLNSLVGLAIESLIMLPFVLVYWYQLETSAADMSTNSSWVNCLLLGVSVVTIAPLLCFTGAAKRLQYSTVGVFQYIGPSLMFVLAIYLYGEAFTLEKMVTFGFIWGAVLIYAFDSISKVSKPVTEK